MRRSPSVLGIRFLSLFVGLFLASVCLGQGSQNLTLQPRMGQPIPGLTPAELARFQAGKAEFTTQLSVAQGLGPILNQTSCDNCHGIPAAGGAGAITVTRFGIAATGQSPFDPMTSMGGSLLQAQTISPGCEEFVPAEADVIAQRVTTPLFGVGLIESVPDSVLRLLESSPPPGISGRAHLVTAFEDPPNAPFRVGRFGWKAQLATVLSFSADASLNELGLTNRFLPVENAPNGNQALLALCDMVPDPEDGPDAEGFHRIDRQTDFQRFLAPPPQTPRSGMTGANLFVTIRCADCHTPVFTTGTVAESALSGKLIRPFSDFLLHDMGTLGDGIVQGNASERELRTAPLWGLSARESLLHDGRATGGTFNQNVAEAILAHDGEALASRNAFVTLPQVAKDSLLAFLRSLGRAEFDWDGDNDVDTVDWFFIRSHVTGPVPAYVPDDAASIADIDQDGDIDLIDFAMFQRAFGQ